jgi:late competence protein required for DNA uptake (superfamily II DNA/RNA helicase)
MSKRQEKIERRKKEQQEFLQQRRAQQLIIFETGIKAGNAFYEANKDKISPEEQALIEAEMKTNDELLEKLRKEANGSFD